MLRKLLKYDFRALNRFLIILHVILLASAFLGRIALRASVISLGENGIVGFGIFLIIVYAVALLAALNATLILVGVYFYRNLYSDEGYLTHTLPVSAGELLASKAIAGSVWLFADQILMLVSFAILVSFRPVVDLVLQNKAWILQLLQLPENLSPATAAGSVAGWLLLLALASSLQSAAMIYTAVTVGQLFSNHRVWAALVAYGILNAVLGNIAGIGTGVLNGSGHSLVKLLLGGSAGWTVTAAVSVLLSLAFAAAGFGVTWRLMKTKLNLS